MTPDWQLPAGVDRGLWDYFHSQDMVAGYDAQMAASDLAAADVAFCAKVFAAPGRLVDLGCGTGRLAIHFAKLGHATTGVDLSAAMLAQAAANAETAGVRVDWVADNLAELGSLADGAFDSAACLFSTWGMVRGAELRAQALRQFARVLRPGGSLVLHAHNRFFPALGARTVFRQRLLTLFGASAAGELTRPQAYGGAPLTLYHATRRGLARQLAGAGFAVRTLRPVRVAGARGVYGWLAHGVKA